MQFDLPATGGTRIKSSELAGAPAVVLVFLAADCPISNRYAPVLHALESDYRKRSVKFAAVFSGPGLSDKAVAAHLKEYGLDMAGMLDSRTELAHQTGAQVTPEVVVLASGKIAYRGRIDDRYVDWGKTRPEASEHDLRDALDAVLAKRAIVHPVTKALGCAIAGLDN